MPEPAPPVQTIVWRDGKTRITTDNAYLEISNRVQVRFTEEFPDDNTQLPGTGGRGRFARHRSASAAPSSSSKAG